MKNNRIRLISFMIGMFLLPLFLPSAHALLITDTILWNSGTGIQIDDNNTNNSPSSITPFNSWTHNINDNIAPELIGDATIDSATLLVTYSDINGATTGELWNLIGIGDLLNNVGATSFPFGAGLLADLQADGLFTVNIVELSSGRDFFNLMRSDLTINYTINDAGEGDGDNGNHAAPEPATLSLLGLSLAGLGIKRFFRKS